MANVETATTPRPVNSTRFADVGFAAIGAMACLGLLGYFSLDLSLPVRSSGDHLFMLVQIKKILIGSGWRFEPHLGFPGVQDQLLFPLFDTSFRAISALIAKFSSNIFLIDNLTYAVGISLIYLFSYYAFRAIKLRPWIAFVGGIAFTVSMFLASRSYAHDYLALYYSVPLGAVMCLVLARDDRSSAKNLLRSPISILALVVVATSGLYYAFFTSVFLMFTACAKVASDRKLSPLVFATVFSALLFALMLVAGYGLGLIDLVRGDLPSVGRAAGEQIPFALFLSSGMHVFADVGILTARFDHYVAVMSAVLTAPLLEWPGIAITVVILSAPILVFVFNALPRPGAAAKPRLGLVNLCLMLITIGIVFAASGGLGFIFNFLVTPIIRAQARILPFLAFFGATVLLFGIQYISELRNAFIRTVLCVIAVVLMIGSDAPVFGSLSSKQLAYLASPNYASIPVISAMLTKKDAAGVQAVLQLPYAGWPELPNVGKFALYDHQLPYLLDRLDSPTKWSYGLAPTQPEFKRVSEQLDLDHLPADLAHRAMSLGFDAILIEKAAYSPEQLASIEQTVDADPAACSISDDAERVLFSLGKACAGN